MSAYLTKQFRIFFLLMGLSFVVTGIFAQPVISSFSPLTGPVGTVVTINGNNFSATAADNIVYFGNIKAPVISAATNGLTAAVPIGATFQPISVTVNGRTAYSRIPFSISFSGGLIYDSSFGERTDYFLPAGELSYGSAVGDFDGDGKLDIAATAYYSGQVNVFRNISAGSTVKLATALTFNSGIRPYDMTVGDLDGDGRLDIVAANISDSTLSVLRNTSTPGNISFAARDSVRTGPSPGQCTIADIDGDGRPDIIYKDLSPLAAHSYAVYVLKNTSSVGMISFAPRKLFALLDNYVPGGIAIGDLNADGKPDLAIGTSHYVAYAYQVSVFINKSVVDSIGFDTRKDFGNDGVAGQLAIADIDGDARPDIVASNSSATYMRILINSTSGGVVNFGYRQISSPGNSTTVAVTDMDGDGKTDIVEGHSYSYNGIKIYKNTSTVGDVVFNGPFGSTGMNWPTDSTNYPKGMSIGDMNGDGLPDFVYVRYNNLVVIKNKTTCPIISSFAPTSAVTGGTVSISGFNFSGVTAVSFGGVPAASFSVLSATSISAVLAAGSNNGVVAVSNSAGSGLTGSFTFEPPVIDSFIPASGAVGSVLSIRGAGFNPVPQNNLVLIGGAKATIVSGTDSSLNVIVPPGTTFQPISVTNRNLIGYSAKPFIITFAGGLPMLSSSSFNNKIDIATGNNGDICESIAMADLDGDGRGDIITTGGIAKTISIHINTSAAGRVSFAPKITITRSDFVFYPKNLIVSDFDGDGKPDILVASPMSAPAYQNGTIWIYRNTSTLGAISFADSRTPNNMNIVDIADIELADVDKDGRPDIVISSFSTSTKLVRVIKNRSTPGNIQFLLPVETTSFGSNLKLATADFDGDGRPDFATINPNQNTISLYKNSNTQPGGNLNFAARTDLAVNNFPTDITAVDFDNDNKIDIAATNRLSGNFALYRNVSVPGTFNFFNKQSYTCGSDPQTMTAGDINGDGRVDLLMQQYDADTCRIIRNRSAPGAIIFTPDFVFTNAKSQYASLIADVDGDGKPDLLLGGGGTGVPAKFAVFRNRIGEPDTVGLCPGGNLQLTSNLTGTNYQWQLNTGSGFVNISDGTNYSGTTSNNLQLIEIPSTWYGYQFRCLVDGTGSTPAYIRFSNSWLGGNGNAWENAANWSCGSVPDANTDVVISSGTMQINANTTIRTLTVKPGVNLTVAPGVVFTILH